MIKIASNLSLPLDLVTESIGILAIKRVGKSYLAQKIVEQILQAKQQVVVVDPKGDWWGLRAGADGDPKGGFPILILGGEHGDLPLEVNAGETIGRMVVEERVSVILDLSDFRKSQIPTFMALFLETLYRLKAKEQYRTPVMLAVDEADAIAPQRPDAGEARMLGAAEDIVRRGGQRGIGSMMITQRAAVLNKNVLTQIGLLFILRTISPQDTAAMAEWYKKNGKPEQIAAIEASIASLPKGEAWAWSPSFPDEAGLFKRIKVFPKVTFDSGATPKAGQVIRPPKSLAEVDLEALKSSMAATIEKAKAEDPKELRRQIAELNRNIEILQKEKPEVKVQTVEIPIVKSEDLLKIEKIIEDAKAVGTQFMDVGIKLTVALSSAPQKHGLLSRSGPPTRPVIKRGGLADPANNISSKRNPPPQSSGTLGDSHLTPKQRAILEALAFLESMGIPDPTRVQLALWSGQSPKSSTYEKYLSMLKTDGYVLYPKEGRIELTEKGREEAGPPVSKSEQELHNIVSAMLTPKKAEILKTLIRYYPSALSREELAQQSNMSANSSTFEKYVSELKSMGVADYPMDKFVAATGALFLED